MALIQFQDLPSTNTPINASNLNNNFNEALLKSGGTMTGKLILSNQGYEDSNAAGYTYDQYGNMRHKRNDNGDTFSIQSYNGTNKFTVYPETGKVNSANGFYINNTNILTDIVKTQVVDLCTDQIFTAGNSPATASKDVPQISGYKAVFITLENEWDGNINLWYCNLSSDGQTIYWRAKNLSTSSVTATIRVKVLYIKLP